MMALKREVETQLCSTQLESGWKWLGVAENPSNPGGFSSQSVEACKMCRGDLMPGVEIAQRGFRLISWESGGT